MDAASARPAKKKKRIEKKPITESSSAPSAEERLAAFGDAFLESIEGPPLLARKEPRSRETLRAAKTEASFNPDQEKLDAAARPGKRKKKKKGRSGDPSSCTAGGTEHRERAVVSAPAARLDINAASSSLSTSGKPSSDKSAPRAPPRMSAAEKRRFMSGKVSDIRSKGGPQNAKRHAEAEEDAEFRKTLREVLDYVTPQLGKQERRQYEQAKIRALGGQLDERPKRPINLLKQDAKIFEAKRKAKLEEEKHMGVSMSASKHRGRYEIDKLLKEKKEMFKEKKRKREDGFLRLGLGAKEHRGMAVISKGAIRKYSGRG